MSLRLAGKANLIVAATLLAAALALGAVWLRNTLSRGEKEVEAYRAEATDRRRTELKSLVEVASGAIEARYRSLGSSSRPGDQRAGDAEERAKSQVLAMLRAMKYRNGDYFWVNDLHPRMLMHPYMPELEGVDVSGYRDPDGLELFQEFVRVCQRDGSGFVSYRWARPGTTDPQPKLSYVRLFAPWGWIVGTGAYVDDIEREVAEKRAQVRKMVRAEARQILWAILSACFLMVLYAVVSERKKSEAAAVAGSEERLRRIFESAPDGIVIFDVVTFEILLVNPALAALLGRSQAEVVGTLATKHGRSVVKAALERGAKPGSAIRFGDEVLRKADGTRLHVEATGTLLSFQGRECVAAFVRDITDRKAADEALRRQQALLASVLNNTDNAILLLDENRRAIYYNEQYVRTMGLPREFLETQPTIEELIRRACKEGVYAPDDESELIARRLDHLARSGETQTIDTPRQDGAITEGSATQLPDGRYLLAFRDATERRAFERALVEQKEFSESLIRKSAVAIFVVDRDHRVLFWNEACEELTGRSSSEIVGTDRHWSAFYAQQRPCLADFVIDGQAEAARTYYSACGKSALLQGGLHAEGWFPNLGGTERYIVFDAAPIHNSDGALIAAVETLQDITDRKRAEENLLRLATAVEQAAEAIVVTDPQGVLLYVNPAFEQVTGYSREEALGQTPRILKSGHHDRHFYEDLWGALTRGQVWKGHLTNRRKDGALYEEEATISPVRDRLGEIINFVAVKRDVTKELQLERHVAQAQKMEALGTLSGGIAHDFNNILAAIMGYTEMTLDDLPESGRSRQNLEHVLTAAERARTLVRQILAFSRRGEEERRPVRVSPIVREALEFLRATMPATVEIRQNLRSADAAVVADPTQIHQVLMNLCTNAFHAMKDAEGVLDVEVAEVRLPSADGGDWLDLAPGDYVRLTVADTGSGIAPAVLDRIFEPFFTTKEVGEGTGMGLAVVHGIVRGLGGEITVRSEVGVGSTFQVYLPATGAPAAGENQTAPMSLNGRGRILIVDDEPVLVDLLRDMLEDLGYEVVAKTSSPDALAVFEEDPDAFAAVITDQTMPKMTGLALSERIKRLRPHVPVILCTGNGQIVTQERARQFGIQELILKPMTARDLGTALRRALEQAPLSEGMAHGTNPDH